MDTNNKPKPNTATPTSTRPRYGTRPAGTGARPGTGGTGDRKPRAFFERPKPEFDQKMVSIRRVTRVVSGGRRMTFAVALAIGDKKGSIGLGTGKGADTAVAIAKALRAAKKSMFKIALTKEMSIAHETAAKFGSSKVAIMPNKGKGLVAGSTVRDMLVLAGVKNVTAKLHSGSKNKLNNARAAYDALASVKARKVVAKKEAEVVEAVEAK
ncbi:MAG: 30S ribosomal protein S5 [Candidatus Nomurabacteria bacterium]|nr:30S ribosomal protein S5 [Candidatus Nomurabacteria bacterium]